MKNLKKLGTVLTKLEQRAINGGIHKCGTSCPGCHTSCRKCGPNNYYFCPHRIPTHGIL